MVITAALSAKEPPQSAGEEIFLHQDALEDMDVDSEKSGHGIRRNVINYEVLE